MFGSGSPDFTKTLLEAQKWQKKYIHADDIPNDLVPSEYDFRNINGFDFTNEVRQQGPCGSCYTMAFV